MGSDATRVLRGAVAGAAAAGVWAAQQPLDKRLFGVDYDDAEFLGTVVTRTRGREALAIGTVMHLVNGAAFGALYALVAPNLPGPAVARGLAAGMAEHLSTWQGTRFVDRVHPAAGQFPRLWGNHAAFAQATWRHVLFGAVLGAVERRLNPPAGEAAPAGDEVASTNGHGDVAHLVTAREV